MSDLIDISSKEVITILESTGRKVLDVFTNEDTLNLMLDLISKKLTKDWDTKKLDVTLEKDRKIIISKARSIASLALRLDEIGKEEVAKLKELPKKVDEGRRYARTYFETWKETIRSPVTEWEHKQEQIKLLAQIILDHEQALIDNVEFNKQKALEKMKQKEIELLKEQEIRDRITKEVMQDIETIKTCTKEADYEDYDKEHKIKVHKQLLNSFIAVSNISSDDAKAILKEIIKGNINHIKVIY